MKCILALLLALAPLAITCPAQVSRAAPASSDWQGIERAKLLAGVTSLPKLGVPGPVALWGNLAFPIISAADGQGPEMALMAGTGHGQGRILIMGHDGYLAGAAAEQSGLGQLLVNSVRWAAKKDQPTIGIKGASLAEFLTKKGFRTVNLSGPLTKASLGVCDLVILGVQRITDPAEGQAVLEYVKHGGGVIAAMTGWAFEQTSGGKMLSKEHGFNLALMTAGLAFTDASNLGGRGLSEFQARRDLPRLMNASDAVTAIKTLSQPASGLSPQQVDQCTSAIQLALAAQPAERNTFHQAVLTALGEGTGTPLIPTKEKPLTQAQHATQRIRLGLETRILRQASTATVAAHPASASFPGQPAKDSLRVGREVRVDLAIPGWTSTGLYAVAGEPISVAVPAILVEAGGKVRIGCHTDTLYHLDKWSRAPEIVRTLPLQAGENRVGSAFGGLIYIDVPAKPPVVSSTAVIVKIYGAVEAPYFKLGRDTDEKWNTVLKKAGAPWAEFASDKMILSVPSEVARRVTNPTELMEFWDRVVTAQDDIAHQTAERVKPERMVADVQISAGFMHSGYPIMIHTPEALEMVTYGRIKFPGWGFYHEIGHNRQRPTFTFEGTVEVTNNVFGLYCYTEVLKKDLLIGHTQIAPDQLQKFIESASKASGPQEKWALWTSNPFHALTTYIQLVQGFGWEHYKRYIASYADAAFGPLPKNDDEKRDQFLVRFSKITGKNLGPFFDFWGIPVSSGAKAEVSQLEPWMPKMD